MRLVLSRQETLSATIAFDCVCARKRLVGTYGSSVCRVLCQLQHRHIVSVFSSLQLEASWIDRIVTFSDFGNNFAY